MDVNNLRPKATVNIFANLENLIINIISLMNDSHKKKEFHFTGTKSTLVEIKTRFRIQRLKA